jgi:hypothetical protein
MSDNNRLPTNELFNVTIAMHITKVLGNPMPVGSPMVPDAWVWCDPGSGVPIVKLRLENRNPTIEIDFPEFLGDDESELLAVIGWCAKTGVPVHIRSDGREYIVRSGTVQTRQSASASVA